MLHQSHHFLVHLKLWEEEKEKNEINLKPHVKISVKEVVAPWKEKEAVQKPKDVPPKDVPLKEEEPVIRCEEAEAQHLTMIYNNHLN